ncbi:oligosaccharide flippase family protein [Escherichia coli]|uniref:oligosaccharide flippase family protein n=1 Tax=Escherichia coli TaxID=562 RepID=UPI000BE588F7|nr:oligosaccharide flippase family protein [Escherichia coli]EEC8032187.1 oligosaccharide flippase family protein [Escherichia coli]EED0594532.1 oligosaccharide flippase family protein [Escherichia coli]EES0431498.1 oligosaccharide flippase family protein [Escherichia coli]EET1491582.1 oligosaccharide flippase family protein [Escherichia coli]EEV2401487.1 oligosaccharide flippase family protein [Escherichia coli]
MNLKSIKSLFYTGGTSVSVMLLGIITGILTARTLGAEGRGIFAEFLFWPQLISSVLILGLNDATAYFTAKYTRSGQEISKSAIILSGISIVISIVVTIIFACFKIDDDYLFFFLAYSFIYYLFFYISNILLSYNQGKLDFLTFNLFKLISPITYFVLLSFFYAIGKLDLKSALISYVLSIVLASTLRIFISRSILNARVSLNKIKLVANKAIKFFFTNFMMIASQNIDKFVLFLFFTSIDAGEYVVAGTIPNAILAIVALSIQVVAFPNIANQKTQVLRVKSAKQWAVLTFFGNFFVCTILYNLSPYLINFFYGTEFNNSIYISQLLIISVFLQAIRFSFIYILRGLGEVNFGLYSEMLYIFIFSFFFFNFEMGRLEVLPKFLIASNVVLMVLLSAIVLFNKFYTPFKKVNDDEFIIK